MISVCNIRAKKKETYRKIIAAVENLIDYPVDVGTPTSELTTIKIRVNSAISDVKSRYMCVDLKDFYLNNQMDIVEYIMIHISMIPQQFVEKYNLK